MRLLLAALTTACLCFASPINTTGRADYSVHFDIADYRSKGGFYENQPYSPVPIMIGHSYGNTAYYGGAQNGGVTVKALGSVVPSVAVEAGLFNSCGSGCGATEVNYYSTYQYIEGRAEIKYYVTAVPLVPNLPLPVAHVDLTTHGSVVTNVIGKSEFYPWASATLTVDGSTYAEVVIAGYMGSDSFSINGHDAHPLTFFPNQSYEVDLISYARVHGYNQADNIPAFSLGERYPLTEYAKAEVDPLFELDPADAPYSELQFSPNLEDASTPPDATTPSEVPEPSTQSIVAL